MLTQKIDEWHFKLHAVTKVDEAMRRLCTVPGDGPVTVGAIMAFKPDLRTFTSGWDVAAWLWRVPRQRSTGGKTRLGGMSKVGRADIRKLRIVVGAMSGIRWMYVARKLAWPRAGAQTPHGGSGRAPANKMARTIGAMMTRDENYRKA